jgi:hypothetical protein
MGATGPAGVSLWQSQGNTIYYNNGNVGIGTTNPGYIQLTNASIPFLDISGTGATGSVLDVAGIIIGNNIVQTVGTYSDSSVTISATPSLDYNNTPYPFGQRWIQNLNSASIRYNSLATSANGQYITAINSTNKYQTNDYGIVWNSDSQILSATCVCMSASGQYQSICTNGDIWYSTNYGKVWYQSHTGSYSWSSIAISASGQYQTAVVNGGAIWYSTTYGTSWISTIYSGTWSSIAMSASGQYQTATIIGGDIWYSTNYGRVWKATGTSSTLQSPFVAISASGQYQTVIESQKIWCSSNYGISYITNISNNNIIIGNNLISLAMTASGQYQIIVASDGFMFTSINYGRDWYSSDTIIAFTAFAISSTGQYIYAASANIPDYIYISQTPFAPITYTASNSYDIVNYNTLMQTVKTISGYIPISSTTNPGILIGMQPNSNFTVTTTADGTNLSSFVITQNSCSYNMQTIYNYCTSFYIYPTAQSSAYYAYLTAASQIFTRPQTSNVPSASSDLINKTYADTNYLSTSNGVNTASSTGSIITSIGTTISAQIQNMQWILNTTSPQGWILSTSYTGKLSGTDIPVTIPNFYSNQVTVQSTITANKCIIQNGQATGGPYQATNGGNGDRLIFWPGSSSSYPYSLGINIGNTMWYSVPSAGVHSFYIGGQICLSIASQLNTSGTLSVSGNSRQIVNTSDQRIKTNIEPITDNSILDKLTNINVYQYNRIDDKFKTYVGFIAQNVEVIFPNVVDGKKYEYQFQTASDGLTPIFDASGNIIYALDASGNKIIRPRGFDSTAMLGYTLLGVQELYKTIKTQQTTITGLESKITSLQSEIDSMQSTLSQILQKLNTSYT